MVHHSSRGGLPVGNPIANVLVVIVGLLTIGISVVLGFVAFVILGAAVLVAAAVIGLRVWWCNRKLQRGARADRSGSAHGEQTSVIEGEYRVVRRDRDEA
jgi:protein-S-isoprenylcysteine O-methyltransferase Ste14